MDTQIQSVIVTLSTEVQSRQSIGLKKPIEVLMVCLKCDTAGCMFVTEDGTLDQKLKHLELYLWTHPAVQQQRQQGKPNKIETPNLKSGIGTDDFNFVRERWDNYKRVNRVDNAQDIRD